jgi:hypothetical protein
MIFPRTGRRTNFNFKALKYTQGRKGWINMGVEVNAGNLWPRPSGNFPRLEFNKK